MENSEQVKSSRPKPLPVSSGGNDKMKDKKVDLATILFFIALIDVLFFGAISVAMKLTEQTKPSPLPEGVTKFIDPANGVTCYTFYGHSISCVAPEIDRD